MSYQGQTKSWGIYAKSLIAITELKNLLSKVIMQQKCYISSVIYTANEKHFCHNNSTGLWKMKYMVMSMENY